MLSIAKAQKFIVCSNGSEIVTPIPPAVLQLRALRESDPEYDPKQENKPKIHESKTPPKKLKKDEILYLDFPP